MLPWPESTCFLVAKSREGVKAGRSVAGPKDWVLFPLNELEWRGAWLERRGWATQWLLPGATLPSHPTAQAKYGGCSLHLSTLTF